MTTLGWILASGVAIALIALSGSLTLLLTPHRLQRILLPMVAFAAGTLLCGALLHMLPESIARRGADDAVFVWLLAGFTAFFALEQLLHWRHSHCVDGGQRRRCRS